MSHDHDPAEQARDIAREMLARRPAEGLVERAERRTLGPAGTTDPRAALIRTDPGRHAANRGPAFGPDDPPMLLRGGPVLPAEVAASWGNAGQPNRHVCPEVEPSRDGWWFAVGLGTGIVLSGLLLLVVTLW